MGQRAAIYLDSHQTVILPETDGHHPASSGDLEFQRIHVTGRNLVGDIFDPTGEDVVENRLNGKRLKLTELRDFTVQFLTLNLPLV